MNKQINRDGGIDGGQLHIDIPALVFLRPLVASVSFSALMTTKPILPLSTV